VNVLRFALRKLSRAGSEAATDKKEMRKLEKPTARGPSPREKAERALGPKLNRKSKPPPDPSVLFEKRKGSR
jgi:hypothetical protein